MSIWIVHRMKGTGVLAFQHPEKTFPLCPICAVGDYRDFYNTTREPAKSEPLKVGDKYNGHEMTPLTLAIKEIVDEYKGATQKFGAFHSAHEGYAVILEELDELKDEVFKQHDQRTKERLRAEAKQVATMALRFMVDITS
jgi:hypothetical protein